MLAHLKTDSDLKKYSDLKKLFGSQKIIQISKYLKCKIKHTSPQGPSARPRQESWIGEHYKRGDLNYTQKVTLRHPFWEAALRACGNVSNLVLVLLLKVGWELYDKLSSYKEKILMLLLLFVYKHKCETICQIKPNLWIIQPKFRATLNFIVRDKFLQGDW